MSQVQAFDFKGAIQRVHAAFESAAKAKNGSQMAALYSEDATLLPPGLPLIKGRANIQGFWQGFLDAGASDPEIRTVSVEASGELAYEIGAYNAVMPTLEGGTAPSTGKFLVVWRRLGDGTVQMIADMFSPNA